MSREKFESHKPVLAVGTIGPRDSGKTVLRAALANLCARHYGGTYKGQVDGESLGLTKAVYDTATRKYVHTDFKTHADFAKAIITGAAQLDGTIMAGVPCTTIYMNKCDMVDDEELLELIEMESRELLNEYGYPGDDVPVVRGSALKSLEGDAEWEAKILEQLGFLDSYLPEPEDGNKAEVADFLTIPANSDLQPCTKFSAIAYILSEGEGGRSGALPTGAGVQVGFNAGICSGTVSLSDGLESAEPGQVVDCLVELADSVNLAPGKRFALQEDGRTIGIGIVVGVDE